ncbi:MAG: type II toxin-antitoxin system PemK/MazF family toxin [Dolichospermum sp.]
MGVAVTRYEFRCRDVPWNVSTFFSGDVYYISTVIVAPMTTKGQPYPTRVTCQLQRKERQIVLDQIRTIDKIRLVKLLGQITTEEQKAVLDILAEIFAE